MAVVTGRSDREVLARLSADEIEALVALVTRVVLEVLRRVDGTVALPVAGGASRPDAALATSAAGEASAASNAGGPPRMGANTAAAPTPGPPRRFAGPVLVEQDVRDARSRGVGVLWLSAGTLVSPLAADAARAWGLDLEREA